jgi:hypothetical protein
MDPDFSAATGIAGRNLVVCCDGTGNDWQSSSRDTNVVKLFKVLQPDDPLSQLSYYDPGVGTPDGLVGTDSSPWLRVRQYLRQVAGLAWAEGVWVNVAEAYSFLCNQYQPGDRIFLFGFSRGAFTVRAVAGLIEVFGLLRTGQEHLLPTLLRLYRNPGRRPSDLKDRVAPLRERFCRPGVPVHFIGVWDTVETVGISQMLGTQNKMNRTVKPSYQHVRHALALDELRWTFEPRVYDPPTTPLDSKRSFHQVWFRGAHSDVGGGYQQAGLSNIALQWMAGQAHDRGLRIDVDALTAMRGNPCAVIHSEVTQWPFWALVGVFQRTPRLDRWPVHASVVERAKVCGPERVVLPVEGPVEERHDFERWSVPSPASATAHRETLQRPPPWLLPAWLCSVVLVLGWLWQHLSAWSLSLTWQQQLGLSRTHFWDLGRSLIDWNGGEWQPVVSLLRWDQVFVVVYTVCLMLTMALWPWVPNARYPQRWPGRLLARVMLPLALADLLENQFTLWALALVTPPHLTPRWWSYGELVAAVTGLETLFSALKFALLGALLVLLLQMLLAWRPPHAAPHPAQG